MTRSIVVSMFILVEIKLSESYETIKLNKVLYMVLN